MILPKRPNAGAPGLHSCFTRFGDPRINFADDPELPQWASSVSLQVHTLTGEFVAEWRPAAPPTSGATRQTAHECGHEHQRVERVAILANKANKTPPIYGGFSEWAVLGSNQ